MPSFERKELFNHPTQSWAPIHGLGSLLFGLPFMAAGIATILVSMGRLVPPSSVHAPKEIIALIGGLFFFIGAMLEINGLRDGLHRIRIPRLSERHPDEPWLWDYPWNPQGAKDRGKGNFLKGVVGAVIWVGILVPFNWISFFSTEKLWGFGIITGLFDLIFLFILGQVFLAFFQRVRFGSSFLRFNGFPFFLGERIDTMLDDARRLEGMRSLTLTLRCVQEVVETRGSGRNRRQEVVCYGIYEDSRIVSSEEAGAESGEIVISFPLPVGDFSTRLRDDSPRYWELAVKAALRGIDYSATFLLPVYSKTL